MHPLLCLMIRELHSHTVELAGVYVVFVIRPMIFPHISLFGIIVPCALSSVFRSQDVRIVYSKTQEYESIARQLGIMADIKAGVPRTAYMGIVTLSWKGTRVFVTPEAIPFRLSRKGSEAQANA